MLCHDQSEKGLTPPGSNSDALMTETGLPSGLYRRWFLGGLGAAIGLGALPHVPCMILGGASLVGGTGAAYFWCNHRRVKTSSPIPLTKLPTVPTNFSRFDEEREKAVIAKLMEVLPVLNEVVSFKQKESPGANIQKVLARDNDSGRIVVGFCKNGMTCPCSDPQFFELGNPDAVSEGPEWPGKIEILGLLKK